MKPTTGMTEKIPEVSTVIPIQTVVPILPQSPASQRWRLTVKIAVIILLFVIALLLFLAFFPGRQHSYQERFSDADYEFIAAEFQRKQNYDVRIDIDGERCMESIHADERQNIVTFHYTGENGREAGMAMYDFNQGIAALKDSNGTACFFMNAYDLPPIQLSDLQLKARNKEVMEINQKVSMTVNGIIPDGFLEVSAGPLFADLCQGLPSYWLVKADNPVPSERQRRDAFVLHVTVPAGATAAVILLDGSTTGGTFIIAVPKSK